MTHYLFIYCTLKAVMTNTQPTHPFVLADYDLIPIHGQDALPFLQGQLTADVIKLNPGQGQLAAHCNPQGRVISLFFLFCIENGYLLALPSSLKTIALTALKKYSVFYKKLMIKSEGAPDLRLSLNTADHALAIATLPQGIRVSLFESSIETRDTSDQMTFIKHKIPTLNEHTSGIFLPHELNLIQLGAVSLTKGCYTGQEIITRMEHKATLKKHLYLAETKTVLNDGDAIYIENQNRAVGTVVNHAKTGQNTSLALLLLEDAAASQTLCHRAAAPIHLLTDAEHTHD